MACFQELPPELKISILEFLNSPVDLISITSTCRSLRAMKNQTYWPYLEDRVFYNQGTDNPTTELISLANIRTLKASKTEEEFMDLNEFMIDVERGRNLSEIGAFRKTIRWFTRRFLQAKPKGSTEIPSYAEISRIDDAFCVLWLWFEATWKPTKRWNIEGLIDWAIVDRYATFGRQHGHSGFFVHVRTLAMVYDFLISELGNLGPLVAGQRSEDEREKLAQLSGCFHRYLAVGIPNLILIDKGLDGVKKILECPLDDRLRQATPYLDHLVETQDDLNNFFNHHEVIYRFKLMVVKLWYPDLAHNELVEALPSKKTGSPCQHDEDPRNEGKEFEYPSNFWNIDTIVKWVYSPPAYTTTITAAVDCDPEDLISQLTIEDS
ncbi:hypothetical protein TWF481_006260 [Arthrobotrys musiformis]|uniref:F-box domain-containing protein n=1 Tax=Arthrobotrys musiformis TaxID=47236 RepID=A0AAV9WLW3_9PEZI